jgi:FkbM family methyltransferase
VDLNRARLLTGLQKHTRRLGFDIIRHPSSRLLDGHLVHVLRELSIDHVLDVGANVGQFAQFLRSIGYKGTIISFEPVAESFAKLSQAAARDPKWRVVNAALGAEEATATITRASVMASLRTPLTDHATGIGPELDAVSHEAVSVQRLDAIFDEHVPAGARVFAKLAVQGWDMEVLRGAAGCLDKMLALQSIVSVIPLYEGMPSWVESLANMRRFGFELTGMFPILYKGSFRVVEFDAVMVRNSHASDDRVPVPAIGRP